MVSDHGANVASRKRGLQVRTLCPPLYKLHIRRNIMDVSSFSIWKFRYVEGYLEGMRSYDVETTKYVNPNTFMATWIRYDMKAEAVSIEEFEKPLVVCTFSELENTLKRLGMYRVRPEDSRHALAGPQRETK